jgi:hypothetical protein
MKGLFGSQLRPSPVYTLTYNLQNNSQDDSSGLQHN